MAIALQSLSLLVNAAKGGSSSTRSPSLQFTQRLECGGERIRTVDLCGANAIHCRSSTREDGLKGSMTCNNLPGRRSSIPIASRWSAALCGPSEPKLGLHRLASPQDRALRAQNGYSSLRQARGSFGCGFGVRSSNMEKKGTTNGSGAVTV